MHQRAGGRGTDASSLQLAAATDNDEGNGDDTEGVTIDLVAVDQQLAGPHAEREAETLDDPSPERDVPELRQYLSRWLTPMLRPQYL